MQLTAVDKGIETKCTLFKLIAYRKGRPFLGRSSIVLAGRSSGCHLDTPTLKNHTSRHTKSFCDEFLNSSLLNKYLKVFASK